MPLRWLAAKVEDHPLDYGDHNTLIAWRVITVDH
jgi:hypothetical protein